MASNNLKGFDEDEVTKAKGTQKASGSLEKAKNSNKVFRQTDIK